jgi:hypothetical protein
LMTGSVNIPMFVVSRLIMGFAIGQLVTLVPLYQVSNRAVTYPNKSAQCPKGLSGLPIWLLLPCEDVVES